MNQVKYILKLRLQAKGLVPEAMQKLFFNKDQKEVSIAELMQKFQDLSVPMQKANLLARYVVEPKYGNQQVVYNDKIQCEVEYATDL